MSARQVHAAIAAGLGDPARIARWSGDRRELAAHGIDAQSIDLAALRKFAGLAVKVRHNQLRDLLPLTFRLLHVAGLEIELFAAYAEHRAASGYAATTDERARDLIAFLDTWLDRDALAHALLWDVIRHEQALLQLAQTTPAKPANVRAPRILGAAVLYEMQSDPREVAAILRQSRPALDLIDRAPRFFLYQRTDALRMIELDEFGFYALTFADGRRSGAAISRALGLGEPTRAFRARLRELDQAGILRLS